MLEKVFISGLIAAVLVTGLDFVESKARELECKIKRVEICVVEEPKGFASDFIRKTA